MEKPIDHDVASGAATVAGSTAKGALGGFVTAGLVGAALFAAVAAVPLMVFGGAVGVGLAIAGAAGFVAGAAGLGSVGAAIGSGVGLVKGTSKVRGEKKEFDKQLQNSQQNIDATMQQAQQQAYMAGARDGQVQLIQQIQESQAQQTNFAAKHAQKGAVTPEAIVKQREAAASQQHLGV